MHAAEQNGQVNGQTGELVTNLRAGTWAAVAATPTNKQNNIVVHQPTPAIRRETIQQIDEEGVYVSPSEARVIWVKPQSNGGSIDTKMVSAVITQGPLYSIAYSPTDHAVCVIFQYPDHAREFLAASQYKTSTKGYGLLGPGYDILPGQGYSNEAELKRMEFPRNERRRLTFVRSALFCDGLTEGKFKNEIYNMVGEEHVDLVWLFNIGNGKEIQGIRALTNFVKATAVFSGTAVARKCREEFLSKSKKKGPYQGIQVSYSHDPCERPLHLVTQLNDPNASNPHKRAPPRGGSSYRPALPSHINGSSRRAQGRVSDEEGWQTVGRRR